MAFFYLSNLHTTLYTTEHLFTWFSRDKFYSIEEIISDFKKRLHANVSGLREMGDLTCDGVRIGARNKTREEQAFYRSSQQEAVQAITRKVAKKEEWDTIFQDVCRWRCDCAFLMLEAQWSSFGEVRKQGLFSKIKANGGEYLIPKMKQRLASARCKSCVSLPSFLPGYFRELTTYGRIGDQKIPLTRLVEAQEAGGCSEYEQMFEPGFPAYTWFHTGAKELEVVMEHVKGLYGQILEASGEERIMELTARLHWWYCQACPLSRGSAATMEVIAQAILRAKGIPLVIREAVQIDVEVLAEPDEEAFVRAYPAFFTAVPH